MCKNRIFVAYKPSFISSNRFLSSLKKKYKTKKAGFSGTLDPFARGVLIVAFGQYTKLFRFLKKSPKTYRATLWIGAKSPTLDIEKVTQIKEFNPLSLKEIDRVFKNLPKELEYLPPKYSAKKIDGQRAYNLARKEVEFELKSIKTTIFDLKLLSYSHPFLTFEISVSEGGYIRSIADILAKELHVFGSLSYLERLREGDFVYEDEKSLNPLCCLKIKENFYLADIEDIFKGKVLKIEDFKIKEEGVYFLDCNDNLTIIKIKNNAVSYEVNNIKLC